MRQQRDDWSLCFPAFLVLAILLAPLSSCTTREVRVEPAGSVAVWDLEQLSPDAADSDMGELLSAQVIDVLKSRGEPVVERAQLMRTLEELRVGSSTLADESTRLRLGKVVGARRMVFGAYQLFGSELRVDLRMVDVETGRVLKAVQRTVPSGDPALWLKAAREAASQL